jgi:hypothetical protein
MTFSNTQEVFVSSSLIVHVAAFCAALLANITASAEEPNSDAIACAKREALLMMLVEAHGAAPNFATDKLAAENLSILQARSACDNGHVSDAVVFYDRLIAALTTSLRQQND